MKRDCKTLRKRENDGTSVTTASNESRQKASDLCKMKFKHTFSGRPYFRKGRKGNIVYTKDEYVKGRSDCLVGVSRQVARVRSISCVNLDIYCTSRQFRYFTLLC
jgi:hypothetical protein